MATLSQLQVNGTSYEVPISEILTRLTAIEKELNIIPGYTQVDGIRSNNNAWVDTGIKANGTYELSMVTKLPSGTTGSIVTAHVDKTNSGRQGWIVFNTASHKIDYYWPGVGYTTLTVDSNIDFSKWFNITMNRTSLTVTQGSYSSAATYTGTRIEVDVNICIFHSENDSHVTYMNGSVKSMYIKSDSGDYLRNFIAMKRDEDGVFGLYDKVEDKFYTSQTSNAFIIAT